MTDKVGQGSKRKKAPREGNPGGFRSATYLQRICASPEKRSALEAAEAELDRAAEALATLVSAEAFLAKLKDLAHGRARRGRPPESTDGRILMRFLLEATGDVEGQQQDRSKTNRAAAECLIAVESRAETHIGAYLKAAQEERQSLTSDYAAIPTERERAFRAAWAFSFLETADWAPNEKKAINIFLARFGAFDLAIEKSPAPLGADERD